jgi:hypothetical protein
LADVPKAHQIESIGISYKQSCKQRSKSDQMDGVDGYLQMIAGKKESYFVSLLRQAVQRQGTTTEPENEVVYLTEQEFRQALLDRGLHPTLLPPPPRDLDEKPPLNGNVIPPKPPPGWEWVLRKTTEPAEVNEQQLEHVNAENDASKKNVPDEEPKGSPMHPVPGWRWEYDLEVRSFYPVRYSVETKLDIDPDRYKPTISPLL